MKNKVVGFRLTPEAIEALDILCTAYGQSQGALLSSMLVAEADKLNGNPKLMALVNQFREIGEQLKAYGSESN